MTDPNTRPSSSSSSADAILVACPLCSTAHRIRPVPGSVVADSLCPRCFALTAPTLAEHLEQTADVDGPAVVLRTLAAELERVANDAGNSSPLFTLAALDAGKLRAIADLVDRGDVGLYPEAWIDGGRAMLSSYRRALANPRAEVTL